MAFPSTANVLHYLDANALWKFYRDEIGDANIRALVADSPAQVLVSPLTMLEFIGVLMKYYRKQRIGRRHVNAIAKRLRRDCAAGKSHRPFKVTPMPDSCLREAEGILLQHGCKNDLQTNDALHLAIVATLCREGPVILVTSDGPLQGAIQRRGMAWYDPETNRSYSKT